jgi:glutathione synthase
MQILFIADPLESFKIYKDTTFAMMREAQRRGHTIAACEPRHGAGCVAASLGRMRTSLTGETDSGLPCSRAHRSAGGL